MDEEFFNFYCGGGKYNNYSFNQILSFSNEELSKKHDYIQLLFPLDTRSKYYKKAPILTETTISAMKNNKNCMKNMERAFNTMMNYFGYEKIESLLVSITEEKKWLNYPHNFLRISRILKSLKLFGMTNDSALFFSCLFVLYRIEENREKIGNSFEYWLRAFSPELYAEKGHRECYVRVYKKTDFKHLTEIEDGLIGKIYTAYDTKEKKKIVLKELDKTHKKFHLKSYRREIDITNYLHHSNIIELGGYFTYGVYTYLVFEYAENGDMCDYMEKLGKDLSRHKTLILDVVRALDYCLKMGIVHRDVKCENVLITKDGTAKLTDFGLSLSVYSKEKLCSSRVGTTHYMAPEVIKNKSGGNCDYKIDIWSLGVLIYVMYFDTFPFKVSSLEKGRLKVAKGEDKKKKIKEKVQEKILNLDYIIPFTLKNGEPTPIALENLLKSIFVFDSSMRPTYKQVRDAISSL